MGLPPAPSVVAMVKVMVPDSGVAVVEVKVKQALEPTSRVMVAVTVAPVLYINPDGALKTNVPVAGKSPVAPSVMVGPVRVVYEPPVVSALMALPPVAGVTLTAAMTCRGKT